MINIVLILNYYQLLMKDKSLVLGLINGDEKAYKDLYDSYYEILVVYCYSLTNDWQQAEDIVQNTFVKIWTNREKIIINSSLKNYLYRAVYNGFATFYKKQKRREESLLILKKEALDPIIEMDEEHLERKIKLLQAAIDHLPKKCKKVFLMHKKEGYKQREIAARLDISEKTVEKHISRAVYRIKEFFNGKQEGVFLLIMKKWMNV